MRIAILDDYQNAVESLECFTLLQGHDVRIFRDLAPAPEVLAERLADREALVLIRERTPIDRALLERLPNLKLLSQTGKVSGHIDLAACRACGVAVAEGVGSPVAPAELAWALVMAASRHLDAYVANLKQGRWQDSGSLGLGRVLQGRTLGIWGYGKIGRRVAQFGKAFGMQVMVWGREPSRAAAVADGFAAAESRAELFATADVLSLHLRLTPATSACVSLADLQSMKPDALFVNTSRAGLVEAGALFRALGSGRPGFAALDVYRSEPATPATDPLLSLPNVLCAPHLGYVEQDSYELYFRIAFENVVNFAAGDPQNLVALPHS